MQATPASFGRGTAFSLRSDADKARLLGELRDLFGIRVPDRGDRQRRYCGADHARDIRAHPDRFAVSVRTRGNPYYLYLTRVDGTGICAFIDRKVQDGHFYPRILLARLCFDERAFDGTLVDGELLRMPPAAGSEAEERWVFVACDIRADRGQDLRPSGASAGEPLAARLGRLERLIAPATHRVDLATDVCILRVKQHFAVSRLREAAEAVIAGIDYDVNGVVFRSAGALDEESDIVFLLPRACAAGAGAGSGEGRASRRVEAGGGGEANEGQDDGDEEEEEEEEEGADEPPRVSTFFVRRTDTPDVFELYDTAEQAAVGSAGAQIAGVPTMRDSEALRNAPAGEPVLFAFSRRFGKWVVA